MLIWPGLFFWMGKIRLLQAHSLVSTDTNSAGRAGSNSNTAPRTLDPQIVVAHVARLHFYFLSQVLAQL
jgi:hypothetical protein